MEVCLPSRYLERRGVKLFGGGRYVSGDEAKKLLQNLKWGYFGWFMVITAHHRGVSTKYRYEFSNVLRHHGLSKAGMEACNQLGYALAPSTFQRERIRRESAYNRFCK